MKVLVTGAAGFIGMHLAHRLRRDGAEVVTGCAVEMHMALRDHRVHGVDTELAVRGP